MNELVFSIFQAETFLSYIEEMRFLYVLREKSAYEDFKIVLWLLKLCLWLVNDWL